MSPSSNSLPIVARRRATWHADLDAAIVPAAGSDALLARLHLPGALVVTTGQQPGLFTGPLYGVHKALAAAALARRLERDWKCPVVALFWVAGDDHDFTEASVATWQDVAGAVVEWKLPPRAASAPQRSLSQEPVPSIVAEGLTLLESGLPNGASRDETLAWLRRHYIGDATLQAAYAGAMAELLAPYGVLCLDATHAAVKRAQIPVLSAALHRARELDQVLAASPSANTGITAGDGATLVFLDTAQGRDRLLVDGDGFRARRSGERFALAALDELLQAAPGRFSANVLLRPVVESALLPTVAYAAGPAEFRYQTEQAARLYPYLGIEQQCSVPRWSGTAVEPWADRLLDKLGIAAEQLLRDDGSLGREILRRDRPPIADEALRTLRDTIVATTQALTTAGTAIDPVLTRAVAGRGNRLTQITDDLERLLDRHLKRRGDIAYAQFARLAAGLKPGGKPQERTFTAANYLGRYGRDWLDAIVRATDAWANK